jgi:hypothetical protein
VNSSSPKIIARRAHVVRSKSTGRYFVVDSRHGQASRTLYGVTSLENGLPTTFKPSEIETVSTLDATRLIADAQLDEQYDEQPEQRVPESADISSHLHTDDDWRIVQIDFRAAPAHFTVRAEVIAFLVGNRCSEVAPPDDSRFASSGTKTGGGATAGKPL